MYPPDPETTAMIQVGASLLLLLCGYRVGWVHSATADWLLSLAWCVGLARAFDLLNLLDGLRMAVVLLAGGFLLVSPPASGDRARIIFWVAALPLAGMLTAYASGRAVVLRRGGRLTLVLLSMLGATGGLIGMARSERWWSMVAMGAVGITACAVYLSAARLRDGTTAVSIALTGRASVFTDFEYDERGGLVLLDGLVVTAAYYVAYRLKFDSVDFAGNFAHLERSLPIVVAVQLMTFVAAGAYHRHDILRSYAAISRAVAMTVIASALVLRWGLWSEHFPYRVLIIYGAIAVVATTCARTALGLVVERARRLTPRAAAWVLEVAAASLIFAGLSLFSASLQGAEQPFGDAEEYLDMAQQFRAGLHVVSASAPWVYRVATPWLASFASESQINAGIPFYLINIASAFASTVLLLVWLRRFVAMGWVRLVMVTLYLAAWVGPARFVYFTPIYVDPLFITLLLAGLLLVDRNRLEPPYRVAPLLATLVFIGSFSRESMAIIALAFVGCHNPFTKSPSWGWRDAVSVAMPLVAVAVALVVVRQIAIPTEPYSALGQLSSITRQKPIFTWLLSWFLTFGPAPIALIAVDARRALEFLRRHPDLLVYLVSCGVISYVGGVDTERIMLWAAPVVFVLMGRAVEEHRETLRCGPLVAVLAVVQLVSARLFWPIPRHGFSAQVLSGFSPLAQAYELVNRLIVIDTHYGNLWSFWGSRRLHAALLAYDLVLVAAIVVWMRADGRQIDRRPLGLVTPDAPNQTRRLKFQ